MRRKFSLFLLLSFYVINTDAQVINSSYTSSTGERVLQLSTIVPVERKVAWQLFTEDQQLMKWIAPVAHIELKTGGFILTNYNRSKPLTDSSSIRLDIINYLENELLTLKVHLNNSFPAEAKTTDQNLQEIITFADDGPGKTKITSSMVGWGEGEAWNKTYGFFERGNEWTFQQILKTFK